MAITHRHLSDLNQTEHLLKELSSLIPDNVSMMIEWGLLYQCRNQTNDAIKQFEQILKLHPQCVEAMGHLAMLYEETNKFTQALGLFTAINNIQPENHTAHYLPWKILLKQGEFSRAWQAYEWRLRGIEYDYLKQFSHL